MQGRLAMFAVVAQEKYIALREQLAIAESFVQRLDEDVVATATDPSLPHWGRYQ